MSKVSRLKSTAMPTPKDAGVALSDEKDILTASVGFLDFDCVCCRQIFCSTKRRRIRTTACLLTSATIVLLITLAGVLWVELGQSRPPCQFSPGDTRLIYFSSFFCKSISLSDASSKISASIHILDIMPSLITAHPFTVTKSFQLEQGQSDFTSYYLHDDSIVFIWACVLPRLTSNSQFYIVKGKDAFSSWLETPRWDRNSTIFYTFGFRCENLSPRPLRISTGSDEYFLAFHNPGQEPLQFQSRITITRVGYHLNGTSGFPNCSTSLETCTVPITYWSHNKALIVADHPRNIDFGEKVDITWKCNAREWAYCVTVGLPVIVIMVVIIVVASVCLLKRRHSTADNGSLPPSSTMRGVAPRYPCRTLQNGQRNLPL